MTLPIPDSMPVVEMTGPGGPEVLRLGRRPVPEPGPGEILIRVAAAGVNRPDVLQRKGAYPPPPGASDLLGLEVAGEVAACGPDCSRFTPGDIVCALVPGGGYAGYVRVPEPQVLPVPAGLALVKAAAIPETFFTVWLNVFDRSALQAGETLLVHGGTSGIGTTAIMLGKAFGATVVATAGSPEKCQALTRLGADLAVNYKDEDFVEAVRRFTGGQGAHVILDMVGGSYIERNYEAAADKGRIAQIAFLEGSKATVDFTRLMTKRLIHTGSTMRPRTVAEKGAIARALEARVWPLVANGRVRPVIDRTFTLADAAAAHQHLESGAHIGKIVLTLD